MKLIRNSGNDRVFDEVRKHAVSGASIDLVSPTVSLFAFAELRELLESLDQSRLVLSMPNGTDTNLLGSDGDRQYRNGLQARWLAQEFASWIDKKVTVRGAPSLLPQSAIITKNPNSDQCRAITGICPLTTDGLGITPGNQFSLVQCSESHDEWKMFGSWFTALWDSLPATPDAKSALLASLRSLVEHKAPSSVYHLILFHLFKDLGDELDEERIVKSATGIRNTVEAIPKPV